jgi:hypothetical protein
METAMRIDHAREQERMWRALWYDSPIPLAPGARGLILPRERP